MFFKLQHHDLLPIELIDEAYFLTEYKRPTHVICLFKAVALSFLNVLQSIRAALLVQDDLISRSIQIIT